MSEQLRAAPAFQWHPDVHLNWGGEHLYFWRLSFYPGFDSSAIAEALTELLEETGVRSYAAREMIGPVDIILRAWLPMSMSEPDFRKLLADRLQDVDLSLVDSFDVTNVKHQWNWSKGVPRRLHDFDLLRGLDHEALEATGMASDPRDALERSGLIMRTARDKGITFAMAVEGEVETLQPAERRRLASMLIGVAESSEKAAEQTLYEGTGFAAYLLLGRIDGNEINELTRLGSQIMKSAQETGLHVKTTTLISHPLEVLLYREELPPRAELSLWATSSVEDALLSGQDAMTEMREAVFAPRFRGGEEGEPDMETVASFLGSVASFLNSRGGLIVIGAALRDGEDLRTTDLADAPVIGDYLCIGVEADSGGEDWMEYERRLENLLEFHIEPSPKQWIEIDHEYLHGKLMVTVRVLKPDEGVFFFVGRSSQSAESFFIRRGETTIELNRSDADAYRRIDSATGRLSATDWAIVRLLRPQRRLDRYQLASQADMSVSETDSALARLMAGGYVARSIGADEIPRYALDPHWSDTGAPRQPEKSSAA
jgi:hypothetical protein